MSERLGPLQYGRSDELIFLGRQIQEERNYSEETSKIIDSEVHQIVDRARQRAYQILSQNRDKLDLLVKYLLEHETIASDEFEKLFSDGGPDDLPVAASTGGPAPTPPTGGVPAVDEKRRDPGKGPAPAPSPA